MGNDALVLWLSPELARAYFVAVTVAMVGAVQLVATQGQRDDLRWLPTQAARPIGALLIVGAITWFYLGYYRLIFVPGPAGLELMVLFGGGTVLSVWLSRALRRLRYVAAAGDRQER